VWSAIEFVALNGPQRSSIGFKLQTIRVAQTARVNAVRSGASIHFPDSKPPQLRVGDIAVRPDAHIKFAPIGTGDKALNIARRQVDKLDARTTGARSRKS